MDLTNDIMAASRHHLLRFVASLIHELTIQARGRIGSEGGTDDLVRINDDIHRLSGHLRDLLEEAEALTDSRAAAIALTAEFVGERGLSRVLGHSPLSFS